MRINIGSHRVKIPGHVNLDILPIDGVDIVCDITKTPWFIKRGSYPEVGEQFDMLFNDSVEGITMIEVLEHIPFRETVKVLREMHRVLKPGAILHIQVPDCGSMMKMYVAGEVCPCVPHKPPTPEDAKADPSCFTCSGKGRVNPTRWLMAFTGAQKEYGNGDITPDIHKNIFTKERLEEVLDEAGFSKVDFKEDPLLWKIKCNATK